MREYKYRAPSEPWPQKAYKNSAFLNGPDGRLVRIMCEYAEPLSRFHRMRVDHTIIFFGSARAIDGAAAAAELAAAETAGDEHGVKRARQRVRLAKYYDETVALAEKMAAWSAAIEPASKRFLVCTGGGPGLMEAGNRGARQAGQKSMGLNISLPFEQKPNAYQSDELSFEFHYFFMRKFWFAYLAKALVALPGGFGTLDEFFELLTLVQTGKITKPIPIVLYGRDYWENVVNWEMLSDWGVISPHDLELFKICDEVDEAAAYLQAELTKHYLS